MVNQPVRGVALTSQPSQPSVHLLSIPAMSAEVERVFSSTRMLVTRRRLKLECEAIEANEYLRCWTMNKLFG